MFFCVDSDHADAEEGAEFDKPAKKSKSSKDHKKKDRKKDKHRDRKSNDSTQQHNQTHQKPPSDVSANQMTLVGCEKRESKANSSTTDHSNTQGNGETNHQPAKSKHDSPRKFHISNFTLSSEKREKISKKMRKEKSEAKTNEASKLKHSSNKMISSLYGTQSLELKPSSPDRSQGTPTKSEKKCKPVVKHQHHPKTANESCDKFHDTEKVEKAKKVLMKEPYMPEYHHIKRYISTYIKSEFAPLLHVEMHTNGAGLVLHSYQDEIEELPRDKQKSFVDEYMKLAFLEDEQDAAYFIMAIVHGSARCFPDLIDYLAEEHPNMTAKMGMLGKSDIETMAMSDVKEKIYNSYDSGTYRAGPLLQLSLVGLAQEEVSHKIGRVVCRISFFCKMFL